MEPNRCGEYALQFAVAYVHPEADLAPVNHALDLNGGMASLADLKTAAESLGLHVRGVHWSRNAVPVAAENCVAIIPVNAASGSTHFIVLADVTGEKAIVYDYPHPPFAVSLQDLWRRWGGEALYVARDEGSLGIVPTDSTRSALLLSAACCLAAGIAVLVLARGKQRSAARRRIGTAGMSVVEVIVATGVVGLLIALALPGIGQVRESARRVQCSHHMKQLVTAVQNYESTHGYYPGRWPAVHPRVFDIRRVSIQAALLPYLDADAIYRQISFSETNQGAMMEPPRSDANEHLLSTRLPVLCCPSDSVRPGGHSYRGCTGSSPLLHVAPSVLRLRTYTPGESLPLSGVFSESQCRAADVHDGLSNTAFFSERVVGDYDRQNFSPWRDVVRLDSEPNSMPPFPSPDEQQTACQRAAAPPASETLSYAGASWVSAARYHSYYDHVLGPNSRIIDCATHGARGTSDVGNAAISARSMHPGGVTLGMGDGGVRFVAEGIDLKVWRSLASIRGHEQGGDF